MQVKMKTIWTYLSEPLLFLFSYLGAVFFTLSGIFPAAFLILSSGCLLLYHRSVKKTGNILNPIGLYTLGLSLGEAVACLKLSRLSTVWSFDTWFCFGISWLFFYAGGVLSEELHKRCFSFVEKHESVEHSKGRDPESIRRYLRRLILFLLFVSTGCFVFEAIRLGFIPFFSFGVPHAYSYFHLPGVHYFTTLFVLIPALSVLYRGEEKRDFVYGLGILVPLALSILLVSRFQLMFSFFLAIFAKCSTSRALSFRKILPLLSFLLLVYVLITIFRSHSVSYLNSIFEMKNPDTPIFITQPYMYIANNYDNFNVMTRQLTEHSHGLKQLYPFLTLTGLKFFFPIRLGFQLFTTKEELTTVTILYDSWYDFGNAGVALFSLLLGFLASFCWNFAKDRLRNPFAVLIYTQFAFYLLFAFFTTWFSNPAVYFYFAVSVFAALCCRIWLFIFER